MKIDLEVKDANCGTKQFILHNLKQYAEFNGQYFNYFINIFQNRDIVKAINMIFTHPTSN